MNEALRAYRDKLSKNVKDFEAIIEAMRKGHQQTFEVDPRTGERRDITQERIAGFEEIIGALNATLRDLDIKIGS